jgi:two-component system, OmpR family, phosphate regulon response regulator PhoB
MIAALEGRSQILVVEDEPDIAALVAYHLARGGYGVRTVSNGADALAAIRSDLPDLVLLDLMLPEQSGHEVLEELRQCTETATVPVVLLTARREEADRIRGFELGADDYITKPFSAQELVLRVGAVLRRVRAEPMTAAGRVLRSGSLVVDLAGPTVSANGEAIDLTPTELRLLIALMERKGRVQTRRQLLESAWNVSAAVETRTVDMHIQRLRARLGTASDHIETVRGIGYRFRGD